MDDTTQRTLIWDWLQGGCNKARGRLGRFLATYDRYTKAIVAVPCKKPKCEFAKNTGPKTGPKQWGSFCEDTYKKDPQFIEAAK